jgi:hypothetical protein
MIANISPGLTIPLIPLRSLAGLAPLEVKVYVTCRKVSSACWDGGKCSPTFNMSFSVYVMRLDDCMDWRAREGRMLP